MCNCKKNNLVNIRRLALLVKKDTGKDQAIYLVEKTWCFCDLEYAKQNNYQIIEVV